jgi:hypothetical protein
LNILPPKQRPRLKKAEQQQYRGKYSGVKKELLNMMHA